MARFRQAMAAAWLCLRIASAMPMQELKPIPYDMWDGPSAKRDGVSARAIDMAEVDDDVTPKELEEFFWASSDKPGDKATYVSLVSWAKPKERIVKLDKIDEYLESASCNAQDMSVVFINQAIYDAAKAHWDWVNFNDMNTIVLVPSSKKCGDDREQQPWVVRSITFDPATRRARMTATKSTWRNVMQTYVMDFGERTIPAEGLVKRDLIPDLHEVFEIGLSARLPTRLFHWSHSTPRVNTTLDLNCNDCGLQGSLIVEGHMEASIGWGVVEIDRFEVSLRPEGVQAGINLSLLFQGQADFGALTKPSQEVTLLEIPLSGWNIPGLFEFGPRVQLNAGYEIEKIQGSAELSAGVTATIPDTAIAKFDLLAEDSVEVSGWTPVITTQPLEIQAQINAEASVYTEIALSVSLTVLDDNGFGVDLALKVPELTVRTTAGFNSNGFCPNNPNPWGISVDVMVGADLDLEVWKEVDGNRQNFYDIDIFEDEDIFVFPRLCFSFGEMSPGFCYDDDEQYADDVDDDDDDDNLKRAVVLPPSRMMRRDVQLPPTRTVELVKREENSYTISCSPTPDPVTGAKTPLVVNMVSYPQAAALNAKSGALRYNIDVPCDDLDEECEPDAGITTPIPTPASDIPDPNSDHIYEGNWIREYMNAVGRVERPDNPDNVCTAGVYALFTVMEGTKTYAQALMDELGSDAHPDRMALVPGKQNRRKNLMYSNYQFVGAQRAPTLKSKDAWACQYAHISRTCKYWNEGPVKAALQATIDAIEAVLTKADSNLNPTGFSYLKVHQDWFACYNKAAIWHTRNWLKKSATNLLASTLQENWHGDAKAEVTKLSNDEAFRMQVCPGLSTEELTVESIESSCANLLDPGAIERLKKEPFP